MLIISTTTDSTGHSLSANGPILRQDIASKTRGRVSAKTRIKALDHNPYKERP
ncbi:MAG TPA: hypothetical protein VMJ66_11325 [Geobacteraceae bacterium]|nr:hypothetical protein [Geobacteraceae bacterium]